jgi:CRP-like cAMP-binding protein
MKKNKDQFNLQPDFLYQHCVVDWWPALDAHKQIVHVRKGEMIFKEGDEVKGVFFMIEGVAKVHKHWFEEKELVIRFARENDIIGHRGLSTHSNVYPISATALAKTTLCFLNLPFFNSTLRVNADLMFNFLMFFADELQLSEQRMRDLAHMPVRNRVFNTLQVLRNKFGMNDEGFISFPVSRQDIAAYTGAAYETVYKILTEFTAADVIRTDGKFIALLKDRLD